MEDQGINTVYHWVFEILLHKDPAFSQKVANSLDETTSELVANYGRLLGSGVQMLHILQVLAKANIDLVDVDDIKAAGSLISEAVSDLVGYGVRAGYSNEDITTVFRNLYGSFAYLYGLDSPEWEEVLNKTREQFEN